jgi:secreted protein with Ig-like and vWFA domain
MNHQDPLQPWISPDLEARITAWVLGEASPFEIAELTRLISENPELAVFKRRLEGVHGLVTEAHRVPTTPALTLSPERRARILAAIEAPTGAAAPQLVMEPTPGRRPWVSAWLRWTGPIAASVALVMTLGLVLRTSMSVAEKTAAVEQPESKVATELAGGEAGSARMKVALPRASFSDQSGVVSEDRDGATPVVIGGMSDDSAQGRPGSSLAARPPVLSGMMESKDATLGRELRKQVSESLLASTSSVPPITTGGSFAIPLSSTGAASLSGAQDRGVITSSGNKPGGNRAAGPALVALDKKELKLDAFAVAAEPRQLRAVPSAAPASPREAEPANERNPAKPVTRANAAERDVPEWQQEVSVRDQPDSTFSLHVSDASFRLARAALATGSLPDPASVRPEEFYNAFDFGDPAPAAGEAVQAWIEQSGHPFLSQRSLVRIAVRVPASGRTANQPLSLTVLLDTSGSMERDDRAATVRQALASLASLLGPNDTLSLVGFARQPRLLADRLPGDKAGQLVELAARTPAEGGTDLDAALKLAGEVALRQRRDGARNRIVLLTDGAANLGEADPAVLAGRIRDLRQQGVAFDACGIGAEGLDDGMIEALTREGDGRYQVLNSPEEADTRFAAALAGAFRPAAENVKVQVRFNPARVGRYRLIGFEHHRLKAEDFRNDQVDAAELAAEEAAVALYQIESRPDGEGEVGEVQIRFRDAADGRMVERSWTLVHAPQAPSFGRASPSLKLAGTAAFLAEKLRGGDVAAGIRLSDFAPIVNELRGHYRHEARVQELVAMFAQSRRLLRE